MLVTENQDMIVQVLCPSDFTKIDFYWFMKYSQWADMDYQFRNPDNSVLLFHNLDALSAYPPFYWKDLNYYIDITSSLIPGWSVDSVEQLFDNLLTFYLYVRSGWAYLKWCYFQFYNANGDIYDFSPNQYIIKQNKRMICKQQTLAI